nr:MAG TPA: hypothetical protein [Caudoviricetes sp.]
MKGINNHFLFLTIPEETKPVVYSTGGYSLPPFQKLILYVNFIIISSFFYVLFFTGRYNSLPVLSRDMLDRFHERFIFSKATFDS